MINSNLESPLGLRIVISPLYNQAFLSLFLPFQSLALQDGCQKKISSLEKIAPVLESTADSHVLTGSEPGDAMLDKACNLREPCTYDHGLLSDQEIHASGSSSFANKSARSCLEKQCSFHGESGCSTTGSLNYIFFLCFHSWVLNVDDLSDSSRELYTELL